MERRVEQGHQLWEIYQEFYNTHSEKQPPNQLPIQVVALLFCHRRRFIRGHNWFLNQNAACLQWNCIYSFGVSNSILGEKQRVTHP